MLESSHVVAFAAASELDRARVFYEQVLGLPVAEHNDFACVLDANGTMLRITAVPEVCRAGYTVLGWRVTDIATAVRDLAARGVVFLRYDGMDQDGDGVWTAPGGDKVAWFADPDGNILSLTQFLQNHKQRHSYAADGAVPGFLGSVVAVSLVPQHGSGWATLAPVFVAGLGGGITLAPNQSLTLAAVPLPDTAERPAWVTARTAKRGVAAVARP